VEKPTLLIPGDMMSFEKKEDLTKHGRRDNVLYLPDDKKT